jgi:hypothetical protein
MNFYAQKNYKIDKLESMEGVILPGSFAKLMLDFEALSNSPHPQLPAIELAYVAAALAIPAVDFLNYMNYRLGGVSQRDLMQEMLTVEESKLLLGVCRMIRQVDLVSGPSCSSEGFDPGIWLGNWLMPAVPAFGGVFPITYISTQSGQTTIENFLLSAVSGSYR